MVGGVIKIHPGEGKLVGLSILQSFLIGLPRLFTVTAAAALFLHHNNASNLPYVYLLTALLLPFFGFVYQLLQKRLSFLKAQGATLLVLALVSILFRILLWHSEHKWTIGLLMAWFSVEFALTNLVYRNTTNRLVTAHERRRLRSTLASGEAIAAIVGGLTIPLLVHLCGVANLLFVSQAGLLLALANLAFIGKSFAPKFRAAEEAPESGRLEGSGALFAILKNRFLTLVILFYALQAFVIYFVVDNVFYFEIEGSLGSDAQIAIFLGQFWAVIGALMFFYRFFVATHWMAELGLLGSLLSAPLSIALAAGLIVFVGLFSEGLLPVMWLAVLAKGIERIFASSIALPAYSNLYQVMSEAVRSRVQLLAETYLGALMGGVAAIAMLLLTEVAGFETVKLSILLLVVLAVQLIVCFLLNKDYQSTLATVLQRRSLESGAGLDLNDPASLEILERGLQSHRPKEVLYCLHLLEEVEHPRRDILLSELIDHEAPEVRAAAYRTMEQTGSPSFVKPLTERLAEEEDDSVWSALLVAVASCSDDEILDLIEPELENKNPTRRSGAMVAAIRYGGTQGAIQAGNLLVKLEKSKDAQERIYAAQAHRAVGVPNFYRGLIPLLEDEDLKVRAEALRAAEVIQNEKLWPCVVKSLETAAVRELAARALLSAGEDVFPCLEEFYDDENQTHEIRRQLILIFGKSRNPAAIPFLSKHLPYGRLNEEYYDILVALQFCGFKAREKEQIENIDALIEDEVFYGRKIVNARHDLFENENCALIESTLTDELEKAKNGVFQLLSFLYPTDTILKIQNNFNHISPDTRDLAVDLLERTIGSSHMRLIRPLLDEEGDAKSQKEEDAELLLFDRLHELISRMDKWRSSWVRACAIDAAFRVYPPELRERMVQNMYEPDPLISETAKFHFERLKRRSKTQIDDDEPLPLPRVEKVLTLKQVDVFSDLPDETLAVMASLLQEVHLERGEEIITKGELGTEMYIVVDGLLRVHDGDEDLAQLGRSSIVGEFSALDPKKRTASVSALRKSRLFKLTQDDLNLFMGERIEFSRHIIQHLCQRLRLSLEVARKSGTTDPFEGIAPTLSMDPFQREDPEYLSLIEKVIVLKTASIFANTPDNVLSGIAELATEVYLPRDESLFQKGELGTKMYIVIDGRVRVHDQDHVIAELGERALIGEMAALSSEPRTATITAINDTSLLALDQADLFELMWDRQEIVRGIISVIIRRLRNLRM